MAKAGTKSADPSKKKNKAGASVKIKLKKDGKSGKAGKKAHKAEGFEGIARLVDHPMVADLLAVGAMAAVAAIAEHQSGKESSSKMVKSVGKAAATAMGRRLMGDLSAIGGAAAAAAKKA